MSISKSIFVVLIALRWATPFFISRGQPRYTKMLANKIAEAARKDGFVTPFTHGERANSYPSVVDAAVVDAAEESPPPRLSVRLLDSEER
mgnify:CR=1 FL=1